MILSFFLFFPFFSFVMKFDAAEWLGNVSLRANEGLRVRLSNTLNLLFTKFCRLEPRRTVLPCFDSLELVRKRKRDESIRAG